MFVGIGVGIGRQRFAGGFADSYSARVLADGGTIESLSCVANASTLLQQASLLFIPSGYKAGVAYSALPNNGNGDLTWTRNSTATRMQSNGNIGSVGVNVPRLSYMYGSCPSALLEPQRTNTYLRSEDFTQSIWVKGNTSITANNTLSPDGNNNGTLYSANGASGVKGLTQTISFTTGITYTLSVYAKKGSNNFLQITTATTFMGTNVFANFDLNNGVLGSLGSANVGASITSVGNGWYRCVLTGTATTTTSGTSGFYIVSSSTSSRGESNTLNTDVYLWGAQIEQGAYSTTYIATTTATATRIADTFTRNNIYTNGLIGASGGTWFVELKNNVAYTRDSIGAIWIGDNSTSSTLGNAFNIRSGGTGRLPIGKTIAGVFTSLYTTLTDNVKIAIKWNGLTADIFVNGVKVISATAFTATNMEFLYGQGTDVPKFIQAMALFNTPLSDTDCITLTT